MRIEEVHSYICFAGWRNWVFVEIVTDDGLVGTGEATLEGLETAVDGALRDLARSVVGRDPREVGRLFHEIVRDGFWIAGPVELTALSGIEQACWDLTGQVLGVPVSSLLGGRLRDRCKAYANGWYFGVDAPDLPRRAALVVQHGFTALKWDPFGTSGPDIRTEDLDGAIHQVTEVRRAVGNNVDLLIEAHGRFSLQSAIRIAKKLEGLGCYWLEEPIQPHDPGGIDLVVRTEAIPVVLGERLFTRAQFRELLEKRLVPIIQPDVCHVGGILELIRIAAQADCYSTGVAPHNPNGPVATAATLAVDWVVPNFAMQEVMLPWDVSWRGEVVEGDPEIVDGHFLPSQAPGLGVKLNHAELAKHPYQPIDLHFFDSSSVLAQVQPTKLSSADQT
jgi:galactonate dehydratase